jgi:methyl-accepting chemotaxis protein
VNVRNILLVTGDAADQKYLGLLRQNEADFEKYLDEVRPTAATEQERAAIAKVDSGWASYKLAMEKVLVPAMADKNDEAWAGMNDPAFLQQLKAVDDAVQALVAAKTKGASDADDENESRYQHAKLISIVTLSVAAILAVGVGLWLARIIAGPITRIINQISDISSTIASAVEELTATTNEMTRNIAEAAKGSSEIAQNIIGVATAAKSTTGGASDTSKAGGELSRMASELQTEVSKFKV